MKPILIAFLVAGVLLVGCVNNPEIPLRSDGRAIDIDNLTKNPCNTDEDCVPGGDCCGPIWCLNKDIQESFSKENCQGRCACPDVIFPEPVCKCVNNTCTTVNYERPWIKKVNLIENPHYCENAGDCIPSTRCPNSGCYNNEYLNAYRLAHEQDCKYKTMECRPCVTGCDCIDNKCVITETDMNGCC